MTDLISRAELFNRLATVQTLADAYAVIQGMPTVDAVPVVRCRDCKHHYYDRSNIPYCSEGDYTYGWKDDDFCSYGERKDGDGNG